MQEKKYITNWDFQSVWMLGLKTLPLSEIFEVKVFILPVRVNCIYIFVLQHQKQTNKQTNKKLSKAIIPLKKEKLVWKINSFHQLSSLGKKLDSCRGNLGSIKNTRPFPELIFHCHNPKGIKYVTRVWFGISYLHEWKSLILYVSVAMILNLFFNFLSTVLFNEWFLILRPLKNIECKLFDNTIFCVKQILRFVNVSFIRLYKNKIF